MLNGPLQGLHAVFVLAILGTKTQCRMFINFRPRTGVVSRSSGTGKRKLLTDALPFLYSFPGIGTRAAGFVLPQSPLYLGQHQKSPACDSIRCSLRQSSIRHSDGFFCFTVIPGAEPVCAGICRVLFCALVHLSPGHGRGVHVFVAPGALPIAEKNRFTQKGSSTRGSYYVT